MADKPASEKTEQPTPKRLEEAIKKGQIPKSAEVQTVFVLTAGLIAVKFMGAQAWHQLLSAQTMILGHLHEMPVTSDVMQGYALQGAQALAVCVGPLLIAAVIGGLLAGGIQNRFQTAPDALEPKWERLNPVEGFKRVFSGRSLVPTSIAILKLSAILILTYSQVKSLLSDTIFHSAVGVERIAGFLADASIGLTWRVVCGLSLLAALDYTYQCWRTNQDLMMTREEVKDEMKHTEGNPQVKARQRKRRVAKTMRQMMSEVPKADVVVTNPTHLAIALRYDRKRMRAPKVVAKGSRLNAQRIRELAQQHHVPIVENKPLARMMFKHVRVGGEVPAELYIAVAEVLAYVYRVNRFRYYTEQQQS